MLTDFERVLLDLKREIASKSHHGSDSLLAFIAKLEVEHETEESGPEEAMRLWGIQLTQDLRQQARDRKGPSKGNGGSTPEVTADSPDIDHDKELDDERSRQRPHERPAHHAEAGSVR